MEKSENQCNGEEKTNKKVEEADKSKSEFVAENNSKTENKSETVKPAPSALGLLGNYSDSESNGSESD